MAQLQSGERPPSTAVEIVQTGTLVGDMTSELVNSLDRWHDQYDVLAGYCRDEGFESL